MWTYYQVEGRYNFTHYGEACCFARKIGAHVTIKKTWNIAKVILAAI